MVSHIFCEAWQDDRIKSQLFGTTQERSGSRPAFRLEQLFHVGRGIADKPFHRAETDPGVVRDALTVWGNGWTR